MEEETVPKIRVIKLHFKYVAGILGAAALLLATSQWLGIKGSLEYLNAAATGTSLVLSILAIVLTFVSNESSSNLQGRLLRTSEDIQETSGKIERVVTTAGELADAARARDERLISLVGSLGTQIGGVTDTARTLNEATQRIDGIVALIPARLDALQQGVERVSTLAAMPTPTPAPATGTHLDKERFLKTMSVAGLEMLYAAALAKESKKPLDLAWIGTASEVDKMYHWGLLIGVHAAGFLTAKPIEAYKFDIVSAVLSSDAIAEAMIEKLSLKDNESIKTRAETEMAAIKVAYAQPQPATAK